jgi:hypothetical protein
LYLVSAFNGGVDQVFRAACTTPIRLLSGSLKLAIYDTETFDGGPVALHADHLQSPLLPGISYLENLFGTAFRFGRLDVHVHDIPGLRIINCIRNQRHRPSSPESGDVIHNDVRPMEAAIATKLYRNPNGVTQELNDP